MSIFKVELKKVVDDSYEIETGFSLEKKIVQDIQDGLVGNIQKFAIITDSIVRDLYAQPICEQMVKAGYQAEIFSFPAGEKSKTRATKEMVEDAMLAHGYRRDCCIIAVGGGVVTDLAGFVAGTFGRGIPFINLCNDITCGCGCIGWWKNSSRYSFGNEPDRTFQPATESLSGHCNMENITAKTACKRHGRNDQTCLYGKQRSVYVLRRTYG